MLIFTLFNDNLCYILTGGRGPQMPVGPCALQYTLLRHLIAAYAYV